MEKHLATVRKFYPNAYTSYETIDRLLDVMKTRFNLDPHQIMHADSMCCDDVNSIEYPKRAYEMLGPFKMGGLDGFPFAGLTGMGAFAHHVPHDGAVFIYYSPHIGITKEGSVGEIHRRGQLDHSSCCGAAKAALKKLEDGKIVAGQITELDYQQNTLEQILLKQQERILGSTNRLMEATEVIYEAIDERIQTLIEKTNYPCRYILLAGAIFINGDHDTGSFCTYKRFECIDRQENKRYDLMEDFHSIC